MNNQKRKKKTIKTAVRKKVVDDSVISAEYQKKLSDYDERLTGIKSKIVQLVEAIVEADAEYDRVRNRYESAVTINTKENVEQQAAIDKLEIRKFRLNAVIIDPRTKQAREELMERRHEQYERALADLRFESMDVQAKYDGKFDERKELNALLDDIYSTSICKKTVEESHEVGLYTANKKQNIRIALLKIEMEKNMGELAETVLMSDETVLAKETIIDYYNTIDEIIENQKQNVIDNKKVKRYADMINLNYSNILLDQIKMLRSSINLIEKNTIKLIKKKEMYLNYQ